MKTKTITVKKGAASASYAKKGLIRMPELSENAKKGYRKYARDKASKPSLPLNCLRAFLAGGLICVIGQTAADIGRAYLGLGEVPAGTFASVLLIFLGALLTGLGVFDDIARFAGAGSAVPITGFANSIVSPAMEFRTEGMILGLAAKMFTVAGPVLVYGLLASLAAAAVRLILGL